MDNRDYFYTQDKILNDLNITYRAGKGLCSPLSNMYAQARMEKSFPSFLQGSSETIYQVAKKKHDEQMQLWKSGEVEDAINIAFRDRKYSVDHVRSEREIEEKIKTHNLITFPFKKEPQRTHQVYLGRDSEELCTLFDSNVPRGEMKAPCHELIKKIYANSEPFLSPYPDRYIKVVASNGEKEDRLPKLDPLLFV